MVKAGVFCDFKPSPSLFSIKASGHASKPFRALQARDFIFRQKETVAAVLNMDTNFSKVYQRFIIPLYLTPGTRQ
jgi:hypothetical protein